MSRLVIIERRENYLARMRFEPVEMVLAAYRKSIANQNEALERELLDIFRSRTDLLKPDWEFLLHESPNGSLLAALAREKLGLPN